MSRSSTNPGAGVPALRPGIHEAVNSAIDTSSADIDPQLVSKITEHVVSALKKEMLNSNTSSTPPAEPSRSTRARASSTATQPPSQYASQSQKRDHSTAPLYHPTPLQPRQAIPSPPTSPDSSHMPTRYTPPSSDRTDTWSRGSSSPEPVSSDAGTGSRRGSKSSTQARDGRCHRSHARPAHKTSEVEETSLEKAWKPLFDNGKPTARLGQFLRGLAKHLIEDCPPHHSIVVTPGKLADFFKTAEVANEMYLWTHIFGGKLTNQAISRLYLALRCQFHLVQFGDQDVPTIPGLTPLGFEHFMTILIQSYPDQEFKRINKAVKEMPISNADEPSERFPKELTRRLLPATSDTMQSQRLAAAVSLDSSAPINVPTNLPPPPPMQPPPAGPANGLTERGRTPYASQPVSSAYDDDDLRSSSRPIERERQPYTAKEGGGKVHEGRRAPSNGRSTDSQSRPARSNTVSSGTGGASQQGSSRPIDVNAAPRSHRMSMGGPPPNIRFNNSPGTMPISSPYTRSEGTNIADIPPAYYLSNMNPEHEDQPRRTFRRQSTEDDVTRSFGGRSSHESQEQPRYTAEYAHSFSGAPQHQSRSRH